jgi:hypothetical protein
MKRYKLGSERITLYRDTHNDREWVVAADNGDPSEEIVIALRKSYRVALAIAEREAKKRAVRVTEDYSGAE